MSDPILNILIVDDHPIFRNGLKNVLRKMPFVSKIHQAINGVEAIKMLKTLKVEIILMDIDMPEMNGLEASAFIGKEHPEIKIIVLTMLCEPKLIYGMLKNGVSGFLLKDGDPHEISRALRAVSKDDSYFSPPVQAILTDVYRDYDHSLPPYDPNHKMSPAQTEVLLLLCKQYSSAEIAEELNITIHTVHRHRQDLMQNSGSKNLVGLVIYAIEHGLLKIIPLKDKENLPDSLD